MTGWGGKGLFLICAAVGTSSPERAIPTGWAITGDLPVFITSKETISRGL